MATTENTTEEEVRAVWKGVREVLVGHERLRLGEDNILYITSEGEIKKEEATAVRDAMLKFFNMAEGRIDLLIDLNKGGKQTPEARDTWKQLSENEKTGKIAIFGMHPVARIIASFVIGVTKKKDMLFFKTREEALAWLKKK